MKRWTWSYLASLAGLAALLAAAPEGAAGHGRPGTLDPSFGHGGKVFGMAPKAVAHSEFGAAELEDNGDLVVELQREAVEKEEGIREIERRLPDGSLDPSFGKDGRVKVGPGKGLAVRLDGSILVGTNACGRKKGSKGSLLLLDASGNRATDFGEGGCGPQLGFGAKYMDVAPGGAIFLGGTAAVCPCSAKIPPRYEPVVARLQPNGAPDPAFGKNGIVHIQADLAVQPEEFKSRGIDGIAPTADGGVVVASGKILIGVGPNGALAAGFGTGGTAEVGGFSTALTALPGGKLVVAASVKTYSFQPATTIVVSRFLPDGSLDPTFGSAGKFQPPLPEETGVSALAPAPGEGVLVAGETGPGEKCRGVCQTTMFLIRIGADGQYDSSYGNQGILDLPRPPAAEYQRSPGISALAVSATGAAIVTGGVSAYYAYAIAVTPAGALDGGFGEGGTLLERHFEPPSLEPSGLALGPKGEITVAVEGTSGGEEYGGFLESFRIDGRQTRGASGLGISPTAARGEIVRVPGGVVSMWDSPRLLFAVEKRGRALRSYGEKGSVKLPKDFRAAAVAPGVGGRVLVLGARRGNMAVYELGPKGRPVPGFGHHGLAEVRFGHGARAYAATVASGGAVVLAGSVGAWTGAAKLLPDGRLDRRFGHAGRVRHLLGPGTCGTSIASLAGGVVIGSTTFSPYELAGLVRLDASGHVVGAFGHKGALRPKAEGRLLGVFTRHGRITVVTDNEFAPGSSGGVELRAYRPGGSRDLSFGKRGLATGGVAQNRFFHPVAAAQQPDGRIIVAGATWNGELSQVELMRFR